MWKVGQNNPFQMDPLEIWFPNKKNIFVLEGNYLNYAKPDAILHADNNIFPKQEAVDPMGHLLNKDRCFQPDTNPVFGFLWATKSV